MADLAELRRIVEAHFRVYEAREQAHHGHVGARVFYVMVPAGEFDRRYEKVRADMAMLHPELLTFVRREAGEDIIFVAQRPPPARPRIALHLALLLATVATTVVAGAVAWQGYAHGGQDLAIADILSAPALAWGALTFALPVMLILGASELAHYAAARRSGLRPALPLFIPAPPIILPIGTFGGYTGPPHPLPDRKALFDFGVAGPIAGFIVALPILLLGSMLTAAGAHTVPDIGRPHIAAEVPFILDISQAGRTVLHIDHPLAGLLVFNVTSPHDGGGDWAYTADARVVGADGATVQDTLASHKLSPGTQDLRTVTIPANTTSTDVTFTWDDHIIRFGDPLLVILLQPLFPHNGSYLTHPVFLAGWVGLLIGAVKLIPVSKLNGGLVARALLGDASLWLARAAVGGLVALSLFVWDTWIFVAFLVFALGLQHPPPLNDRTKIEGRRLVVAAVVVVIFIVSFVPVPMQV